jgi:hypothetical protein
MLSLLIVLRNVRSKERAFFKKRAVSYCDYDTIDV